MTKLQKNLDGNMASLKEGYVFDRATGKPVDIRKPEETVRQEYEKILFEDYGYDYKQMDIEVIIQRGSKDNQKSGAEKADIVIYKTLEKTKRDQFKDILGIIEVKRKTRKDGVKQLTTYMTATSCIWGVWTNGDEIEYLYHDKESGEVKRDYIFQIPKSGETIEDIGRISKDKLIPSKNLKPIFRRLLNTLYANTNISRREKLGNELIRLIFCKIWDEKYDVNLPPKFRIGLNEKPDEVKQRIIDIFNEVKEELESDGVFDKTEEIKLDAKSIAYVVGELEHFSLLKTDKDVVGDAFEVFAESKLVGEKGEFFTPREVVKTAIELVKPQPTQKILDPACGSGGFLIYALEHVWRIMDNSRKYKGSQDLPRLKREIAERNFFGIDKEIDLVKIAKAYMAIIGDGRGGIYQENTLHSPADYQPRQKEIFVLPGNKFRKFDIILTNPPFGSKTKVLEEEAKNFDLGHIWKFIDGKWVKTEKTKDTEPQILFIERCLDMLKTGGTLAIVLPETYFHATNSKYVLDYITSNNNIQAMIDLALNSFKPFNNAKTVMAIIQKGVPQQDKIIMGVTQEIGHDHNGKQVFRFNENTKLFTDEIWDDTVIIRKELENPNDSKNKNTFIVDKKEISNNIYVPRYYWKKSIEKIKQEAKKQNYSLIQVNELLKKDIINDYPGHGSPTGKYKGKGEVPYIRVKDIVNWEIYKNPTSFIPLYEYKRVKGINGIDLCEKDILFIRRGSYRIGSVAMVSRFDLDVLLARELHLFRVVKENNEYGINPFYFIYLLSHQLTQRQLYNKKMFETTYPNIADRWKELYLPISNDKKQINLISSKIKDAFESKWKAQERIIGLSNEFGNLTT